MVTCLNPFPKNVVSPDIPARPERNGRSREFEDAGLSDLAKFDCVFLCDVPTISAAKSTVWKHICVEAARS